ncbi:MAG: ATP-binding protein [Tatlockia sp.]
MPKKSNIVGRIGQYGAEGWEAESDREFVEKRLTSTALLYQSVASYQAQYGDKVNRFCQKNYVIITEQVQEKSAQHCFFRSLFVAFLEEKNAQKEGMYAGKSEHRSLAPEKATVTLRALLGKKGLALFQLALEEEVHSKAYLNAVFRASTHHYEGEKWAQRPVILIAGPSGSGKSFTSIHAVAKARSFLPKKEGDFVGNDVVALDGGIVREVSQINQLVIQAAHNKGYSGLMDLYSKGPVLRKIKDRLQATVFAEPSLGVVLPDSFTYFFNPFSKKQNLLKKINALPDTRMLFCRIRGKNFPVFKRVVAFLTRKRAWKTTGFEANGALDLNKKTPHESKKYNPIGFLFGSLSSRWAEWFVKRRSKEKLSMVVTNDLLLKKESPAGSGRWVNANEQEKGALLVSERVFKTWQFNQRHHSPEEKKTLSQWIAECPMPPLIQTSGELALAIAKERLRCDLANLSRDYEKTCKNYGVRHSKALSLEIKKDKIKTLHDRLYFAHPANTGQLEALRALVKQQRKTLKKTGYWGYFNHTTQSIKAIMRSIDTLKGEMVLQNSPNHVTNKNGLFSSGNNKKEKQTSCDLSSFHF